jgi:hypothetical protein
MRWEYSTMQKEVADLVKKYNDLDLYQKIIDLRDEIFQLREGRIRVVCPADDRQTAYMEARSMTAKADKEEGNNG